MKEIKESRIIEEVTGYEAFDGTVFKTEDECIKYEGTAEAVITKRFFSHVVKGNKDYGVVDPWSTKILHGYEEDVDVLYHVKDDEAIKDFEMYAQIKENGWGANQDVSKYKGKVVLVHIYNYDEERCFIEGTEEEILEDFTKFVKKIFDREDKDKEDKE
jgi:hypothetical protein